MHLLVAYDSGTTTDINFLSSYDFTTVNTCHHAQGKLAPVCVRNIVSIITSMV